MSCIEKINKILDSLKIKYDGVKFNQRLAIDTLFKFKYKQEINDYIKSMNNYAVRSPFIKLVISNNIQQNIDGELDSLYFRNYVLSTRRSPLGRFYSILINDGNIEEEYILIRIDNGERFVYSVNRDELKFVKIFSLKNINPNLNPNTVTIKGSSIHINFDDIDDYIQIFRRLSIILRLSEIDECDVLVNLVKLFKNNLIFRHNRYTLTHGKFHEISGLLMEDIAERGKISKLARTSKQYNIHSKLLAKKYKHKTTYVDLIKLYKSMIHDNFIEDIKGFSIINFNPLTDRENYDTLASVMLFLGYLSPTNLYSGLGMYGHQRTLYSDIMKVLRTIFANNPDMSFGEYLSIASINEDIVNFPDPKSGLLHTIIMSYFEKFFNTGSYVTAYYTPELDPNVFVGSEEYRAQDFQDLIYNVLRRARLIYFYSENTLEYYPGVPLFFANLIKYRYDDYTSGRDIQIWKMQTFDSINKNVKSIKKSAEEQGVDVDIVQEIYDSFAVLIDPSETKTLSFPIGEQNYLDLVQSDFLTGVNFN